MHPLYLGIPLPSHLRAIFQPSIFYVLFAVTIRRETICKTIASRLSIIELLYQRDFETRSTFEENVPVLLNESMSYRPRIMGGIL